MEPYLYSSDVKFLLQMKEDLIRHEALRLFAYPDPLSPLHKRFPRENWGFEPARQILSRIGVKAEEAAQSGSPWTVGVGDTHGVTMDSTRTKEQAERRLEAHILEFWSALIRALPWVKEASFVTQTVLTNMAFNLGLQGLLGFKNTLRFVREKNYEQAARNMTQSLWYRQTGNRAKELVERMRTQEILPSHKAKEKL